MRKEAAPTLLIVSLEAILWQPRTGLSRIATCPVAVCDSRPLGRNLCQHPDKARDVLGIVLKIAIHVDYPLPFRSRVCGCRIPATVKTGLQEGGFDESPALGKEYFLETRLSNQPNCLSNREIEHHTSELAHEPRGTARRRRRVDSSATPAPYRR